MSGKSKFLIIFAILAIVGSAYHLHERAESKLFEGLIPGAIELSVAEEAGSESYFFHGGCGVAVFRLSDAAARKILDEGLVYFATVTRARDYNSHPITYGPWHGTPVPPSWTSEGSWFGCSVTRGEFDSVIVEAGKNTGAYYTTSGNIKLVVIPALRLVSFSYYD